ncbi:unnamed protein product [Paramecium sonneborni]|uniref:WD40-repeat-containing domain n=1 Tax=Paramecium sonneborni TaxID=65129 RepID=A0A8S1QIK0_9CILI|nr:unnamed protein product [Paramecium sonneborni]
MFILQERKEIIEKVQLLINQQKAQLNELQDQQFKQFQNQNEERQLLGSRDYYPNQQNNQDQVSTLDIVATYLEYLNKFQEQFDQTKEILLLMPQDKKQLQEHLEKAQDIRRSSISNSTVNSVLINHNSEIERSKIKNLRNKLSYFIENYQQTNQMACLKHNQKIEFLDISNDQNIQERRLCKDCGKQGIKLSEFFQIYLIQFFEFKIQSEEKRSEVAQKIKTIISILQTQRNTDSIYNEFNQQFQQRIKIIEEIYGSHIIASQELNKMAKDFAQTQDNFIKYRQQFDIKLKEWIQKDFTFAQLQMNSIIDHLCVKNHKIQTATASQDFDYQQNTVQNINYKIMYQQQQSQLCQVLCFNRNNTLIATAKKNIIIIWRFYRDNVQQITELQGHKNDVSCLVFDVDSDTLISGGGDLDCQIFVWVKKSENVWKDAQNIQNNGGIKVMILNHLENQLITGSQKGVITIWEFKKNCLKKTLDESLNEKDNKPVFGLAYNNKTQQIITCGQDKCIRLFQLKEKLECKILRQCDSLGMRIKFIDDSSFVLVQKNGWLFYYKIEWGTFKEIQKIRLSSEDHDYIYSPIWYNQDRKILIVKHFRKIYFLKKQNDEQFQLIDKLEYQQDLVYATISDDGQYLATWIDRGKDQKLLENQSQIYQFYKLDFQ